MSEKDTDEVLSERKRGRGHRQRTRGQVYRERKRGKGTRVQRKEKGTSGGVEANDNLIYFCVIGPLDQLLTN